MKDIKIGTDVDISGTSLIGYVTTTYDHLVEKLGKPTHTGDEYDKVQAEWNLSFEREDGRKVIASIYDWKQYEQGVPTSEYKWHVGGHSIDVVLAVQELLGVPITPN